MRDLDEMVGVLTPGTVFWLPPGTYPLNHSPGVVQQSESCKVLVEQIRPYRMIVRPLDAQNLWDENIPALFIDLLKLKPGDIQVVGKMKQQWVPA